MILHAVSDSLLPRGSTNLPPDNPSAINRMGACEAISFSKKRHQHGFADAVNGVDGVSFAIFQHLGKIGR